MPGLGLRGLGRMLNRARYQFSAFIFFDVCPWNRIVVRKHREPSLRQSLGVVAAAAIDRLQGIQIKPHDPRQIEVRRGRDEVRNIASGFSPAGDQHSLHVRRVTGKNFY